MFELLGLAAAGSAAVLGYVKTRDFVRDRLRYVDRVHEPSAAFKAGGAALLVATPIVWLVPFIGAPTAILFAFSVAAGVRSGSNEIRKRLPGI